MDFSFRIGLRVKDISNLKIDNVVDCEGRVLDSFHLIVDQSKGDKRRTIFLTNKKLRKNLEVYLDERKDDLNSHLFKTQKTAFTPNSLQQVFKRLYRKAGIEGAKSHSG